MHAPLPTVQGAGLVAPEHLSQACAHLQHTAQLSFLRGSAGSPAIRTMAVVHPLHRQAAPFAGKHVRKPPEFVLSQKHQREHHVALARGLLRQLWAYSPFGVTQQSLGLICGRRGVFLHLGALPQQASWPWLRKALQYVRDNFKCLRDPEKVNSVIGCYFCLFECSVLEHHLCNCEDLKLECLR